MTKENLRLNIEEKLGKNHFEVKDLLIFALDEGLEKVFSELDRDGVFSEMDDLEKDELWDMVYDLPNKLF